MKSANRRSARWTTLWAAIAFAAVQSACSGCEDPAVQGQFFDPHPFGTYVFDGQPKIVAPERLVFQDVGEGESKTVVFSVQNGGRRTLAFDGAKITPGFELDYAGAGAPLELRRGESMELSVTCLLYTSPSPRDVEESRMPSSA